MFTTLNPEGPFRRAWFGSKIFSACGTAALAAVMLFALAGDARAYGFFHRVKRVVIAAAIKSAVPPELALAVAREGERLSGERFGGRVGVMGISPEVALDELGVHTHGLRSPKANAGIGVALLERLYRRYGERWDLALSHYRGGSLVRCESGPVVHERTFVYVAEVMEWWRRHQMDEKVAALIEDIRKRGIGDSRFSEAGGGARVESTPYGDGSPCCAGTRFF